VLLPAVLLASEGAAGGAPGGADWLSRYEVVARCPDVSEFRAAVERRLSQPALAALVGQRLEVTIEGDVKGPPALLGRLRVTDADGLMSTRDVRASSCAELVEALSLVAALSAEAAGGGDESNASPLSGPPLETGGELVAAEDRAPAPGVKPPSDALRLGPTLFVLMQSASTPAPKLGIGAGLSVAWPRLGMWAPWLQLGGYQLGGGEEETARKGVHAEFELLAAQVVASPLRWPARGFWSLQPCVELELGSLVGRGQGSAVAQPKSRSTWWGSTGLALRGEVAPWGPLRLAAAFGATVPFSRHEFFFAPDIVAFRVPALGWRSTLSGALLF
jgi:hypothetical protein